MAVDASRAATGDWQRRGCLGTLHLLYVASGHVVLICCLLDGSRRRGCGDVLAWTWEVMRRVCLVGVRSSQTQSCSAQTLAHMPAAAWCDYMRQAWKKARRRRVEQLVEAERTCARSKECSNFCLVLCDKAMLAHAGGDR